MSTIKARPLTVADVAGFTPGDTFEGYVVERSNAHGMTLTPATLTVRHSRPIYAVVPDLRPNAKPGAVRQDRDVTVGHYLTVDTKTMFGMLSGVSLFTTDEAEEAAEAIGGYGTIERGRNRVYLADESGEEQRLTPVFGAQVTAGIIVRGIDPEEARERAERALLAEFGDAVRPLRKVLARPVEDKRVNVYNGMSDDETPIAVNILSAETSYVTTRSTFRTSEADPSMVVG